MQNSIKYIAYTLHGLSLKNNIFRLYSMPPFKFEINAYIDKAIEN